MKESFTHIAKEVIQNEYKSLKGLMDIIDHSFDEAIDLMFECKGKVIVTGIGKSGLIGRKIASSFASTGTQSFFLHPSEAIHGDLGMIDTSDVILAIANSGETSEILNLLPHIKERKLKVIAITSRLDSSLAKACDIHLYLGEFDEACPFSLAPTTSSTLTLCLGDALTVALMHKRGFTEENYASFHPGGTLGIRLKNLVKELMITSDLPFLHPEMDLIEAIDTINKKRFGIGIVGDQNNVKGIVTDGDLRRAMLDFKENFFSLSLEKIMSPTPHFITPFSKLNEAKKRMQHHKIGCLLVGDKFDLKGIIQLHQIKF